MDNTLYVGRVGRVFIKQNDGSNKVFCYEGSKWANPYKVKDYTLVNSLELYIQYIFNCDLRNQLGELSGKVLGCFCDQKGLCHTQILVEMFKRRDEIMTNSKII